MSSNANEQQKQMSTGELTKKDKIFQLSSNMHLICNTVMILGFRTNKSEQTMQTQIRLLLEEQSDQGLHCLLFNLHLFDEIPYGLASLFEF